MSKKRCKACNDYIERPENTTSRRWDIQKFCSEDCNPGAEISKRVSFRCALCGTYCEEYPSVAEEKENLFCSKDCHGKEIKQNKERYELFEDGHEGYDTSPWEGKTLSEEHRKSISESMKGLERSEEYIKNHLLGENHWNWQGGKSFEPYPDDFNPLLKRRIRQRDDFKCQSCGKTEEECKEEHGKKLEIHHLDGDKTNNEEDNLVSLCTSCHTNHHNSELKIKV